MFSETGLCSVRLVMSVGLAAVGTSLCCVPSGGSCHGETERVDIRIPMVVTTTTPVTTTTITMIISRTLTTMSGRMITTIFMTTIMVGLDGREGGRTRPMMMVVVVTTTMTMLGIVMMTMPMTLSIVVTMACCRDVEATGLLTVPVQGLGQLQSWTAGQLLDPVPAQGLGQL